MRHRGEVVSKSQILTGVWDSHYSGDPNIVEVYVGYLRRKVDAPFGRRGARDRTRRGLPAGGRRWLSRSLAGAGQSLTSPSPGSAAGWASRPG